MNKLKVDAELNIETCKYIQRLKELSELALKLGELTETCTSDVSVSLSKMKPEPILTIILEDETAVPKVFYEGEEITDLERMSFDWETSTDELGGTAYNIDYLELIDEEPVHKGIGLARGKYGVALFD